MITIQNVAFSFKRKAVFKDLTLSFKAGHIYGLLGKNGAGKSTLLKMIAGALFPDNGQLIALNFSPKKRQASYLQKLFIIADEFYLPPISIKTIVKCNAPFYPHFNEEQFYFYLKEFEVPNNISMHQLSYGQNKKVHISFALACNTPILLMDEPTNGLDIMGQKQFKKIIAGIATDEKCIIISTHQVKDLENLIDHITIINDGTVLFNESIEQISSKLEFKIVTDIENSEQVLFKEACLKGYAVVGINQTGTEGKTDLELLYKTLITNSKGLNEAFLHKNQIPLVK
ncbi:MAG: ABC transporter ATP-binding protein [Bacteroidia bacterium]|nr:MAG: ABC transporter ATP-binding protein [Bacteroidia bacterium]